MSRAFLSHSSFDKDFVAKVFEVLGTGRCVFDAKTFKRNADLESQIRDGLEQCDIYVLFLSAATLKSGWVTSELDVASLLRTQWKVRSVLVFQLDDTKWDELPSWAHRYVTSCPPSPQQVALRIVDEIRTLAPEPINCVGREEDAREIIEQLSEAEVTPAYLYFSGPLGIGRRTLAMETYRTYYPNVSTAHIELSVEQVDDLIEIYRKALGFSSNWRAQDYKLESEKFIALSKDEQASVLALLLREISITFNQVVIINLGTSALTEEGRPQPWFKQLTSALETADYPYVWFLSQRFLSGTDLENGLFFAVKELDDRWSALLFKVLIQKYKVSIPSKEEQSRIETSISGHPGLILLVANYLRRNPTYKPNRTHNSIVRMVNETTKEILQGFVNGNKERARSIALFSEAGVLSYAEIQKISEGWPEFEEATSALLDASLLTRLGAAEYSLVSYVQRAAEQYGNDYKLTLSDARKALLGELEAIEGGSFVPVQLLNSKIVEHILDDKPITGYFSSLILPSQQLRAAKRRYDAQEYSASLKLAHNAYDQKDKLSSNGILEAWRLIGLSGIRSQNVAAFDYFSAEYPKLGGTEHTKAIFSFGNGLKYRLGGDLRRALEWFQRVPPRYADAHVYRELAYVYAFERSFDDAQNCIRKALELSLGNPYILDIQAMVLLEQYRTERRASALQALEGCLDELELADKRGGTSFSNVRLKMKEVIVDNDLASLQDLFTSRSKLPIAAKVALLSMLSAKSKEVQFNELHAELKKAQKDRPNRLVEIEVARIEIEHKCNLNQFSESRIILERYKNALTAKAVEDLERLFPAK